MRKVAIISSTAPAKPRSEKYPVGASVTRTSSGTTIVQGGGSGGSVDIIKRDDIRSFTDANILSSLRVLAEFISKKDDSEVTAIIDYLKGLKINGDHISRLLLKDTVADELLDTDIMSALRVMAEINENNDNLEKLFLSKVKKDRAAEHITFEKGGTAENGFIVRLPKQNTPAALMSCLLEEDDTLIEEDEDALMEIAPVEATDLSFGGLNNVNPSVDNAPVGSLPVKGENEWGYAAPILFSGNIDEDNMLIPVFDRRIQQMVFIPISVIRGGVTPPATGFPYTFSLALG